MSKKIKSDGNILTTHKGMDKPLFIVAAVIFAVQCISLFLPIFWMFAMSFKTGTDYSFESAFDFPEIMQFNPFKILLDYENYTQAYKNLYHEMTGTDFFGMVFNSVWYSVLQSGLACFTPCITGYVMSKYRFKGREFIYAVAIVSLTVPIVGSGASTMNLFHYLGLYNNPLRVLVGGLAGFGGSFIVYYGFWKGVSWAYAEAAQIDGAGPFTILFKIMLPQALPVMLTYFITGAIAAWNEYESLIMYMPAFPTLAVGLYDFQETARGDMPAYYAGLVISMIPTLTIFAIFSDKIMRTVSVGGLKG